MDIHVLYKKNISIVFLLILMCMIHICGAIICPMSGFTSCDCTWTPSHHISAINCTDQNIQNDYGISTLLSVAPQIQSFTYTGNNLKELHQNVFGDCSGVYGVYKKLNNLTYIDLSNNSINIINGKTFHCVPSVKTLIPNNNVWNVNPSSTRVFSSMPDLEELQLNTAFYFTSSNQSNSYRINVISKIFQGSHLTKLRVLHLKYNGLAFVYPDTFCGLPNLQKLYLTGNELTKIRLDCLQSLKELQLDNNAIQFLGQADFANMINMSSLSLLNISQNPFQCTNCTAATKTFRNWLKSPYSANVVERNKLSCVFPQKLNSTFLSDVTDRDLEGTCVFTDVSTTPGTPAKTIVLGTMLAVIGLVTIILIFFNRRSIKKKFDKLVSPLKENSAAQFQYSAMDDADMEPVDT